jgi:molybdopterin synthase catalytic subunit
VSAPEVPGDQAADWVALSAAPLPVTEAVAWATTPEAGAVVTFLGVVRDHSEGRDGVTGLTYEAYERVAGAAMADVVTDARRRWPPITRVALLHRTGALALGEAAVAVVVASPHRADAFEAARHCIDTLKESVPIWKHEHWAEGSGWGRDAAPLRAVGSE